MQSTYLYIGNIGHSYFGEIQNHSAVEGQLITLNGVENVAEW